MDGLAVQATLMMYSEEQGIQIRQGKCPQEMSARLASLLCPSFMTGMTTHERARLESVFDGERYLSYSGERARPILRS